MDKKAADEYDKILDMADAMTEILRNSPLELNETQCEDLSIFLAEKRNDVLVALQAKKLKADKPKEKTEKFIFDQKSKP